MKHKTICIIDDEDIIQYIVKTILHNISNDIDVLSYMNGEEALMALQKLPDTELPDVILLDINMPVMSGWQFLEEFVKTRSDSSKKVPIYILTSSTAPNDKIRSKVYKEIMGYINKPIEADTLKQIAEL